jgi:hypothetical protein
MEGLIAQQSPWLAKSVIRAAARSLVRIWIITPDVIDLGTLVSGLVEGVMLVMLFKRS